MESVEESILGAIQYRMTIAKEQTLFRSLWLLPSAFNRGEKYWSAGDMCAA